MGFAEFCLGVNLVSYKSPLDLSPKFGFSFGEGIVVLLRELVNLGRDVIQGLFPLTLDLNPIQRVLISYLNNSMKFIL